MNARTAHRQDLGIASVGDRICINAALEGSKIVPRDLGSKYDASIAAGKTVTSGEGGADDLRKSGGPLAIAQPSFSALLRPALPACRVRGAAHFELLAASPRLLSHVQHKPPSTAALQALLAALFVRRLHAAHRPSGCVQEVGVPRA